MKKHNYIIYIILVILAILGIGIFLIIKYNKPKEKFIHTRLSYNKPINYNNYSSKNYIKENYDINDISEEYIKHLIYLGKGYNLAKENFSDIKSIGSDVLNFDSSTFNQKYITIATNELGSSNFFCVDSTNEYIEEITKQISGSATGNTGGIAAATIETSLTIGSVLTKETKIHAVIYKNSSYSGTAKLGNKNHELINDNFISDIKSIIDDNRFNTDINFETDPLAVDIFELFISKYGSHIISKIYIGSSIYYTLTTTSDRNDIKQTLIATLKSSFNSKMALNNNGGFSFDGTIDTSTEEKITKTSFVTTVKTKGGSPSALADFHTGEITPEKASAVINSSKQPEYRTITNFNFTPIWELIYDITNDNGTLKDKEQIVLQSNKKYSLRAGNIQPFQYRLFANNLKKYYEFSNKEKEEKTTINDSYLVNELTNNCVHVNLSNSFNTASLVSPDTRFLIKFKYINNNIFVASSNACLQSQKEDAIFGSELVFKNNKCEDNKNKWKYNNDDKTITLLNNQNICLDSIVDINQKNCKDPSGPLNGKLILNRCNGSLSQKWSFKSYKPPVDIPLPPVYIFTPRPPISGYKSWKIYLNNSTSSESILLLLEPSGNYKINYKEVNNQNILKNTLTFSSNNINVFVGSISFSLGLCSIDFGKIGEITSGFLCNNLNIRNIPLEMQLLPDYIPSIPKKGSKIWIIKIPDKSDSNLITTFILELGRDSHWYLDNYDITSNIQEKTNNTIVFSNINYILPNLPPSTSSITFKNDILEKGNIKGQFINNGINNNALINNDRSNSIPTISSGKVLIWDLDKSNTANSTRKYQLQLGKDQLILKSIEFNNATIILPFTSDELKWNGNILTFSTRMNTNEGLKPISGIIVFGSTLFYNNVIIYSEIQYLTSTNGGSSITSNKDTYLNVSSTETTPAPTITTRPPTTITSLIPKPPASGFKIWILAIDANAANYDNYYTKRFVLKLNQTNVWSLNDTVLTNITKTNNNTIEFKTYVNINDNYENPDSAFNITFGDIDLFKTEVIKSGTILGLPLITNYLNIVPVIDKNSSNTLPDVNTSQIKTWDLKNAQGTLMYTIILKKNIINQNDFFLKIDDREICIACNYYEKFYGNTIIFDPVTYTKTFIRFDGIIIFDANKILIAEINEISTSDNSIRHVFKNISETTTA